jgi:hypothetical protein
MARLKLKRAVTYLIVKLQAYKFNQQIKRTIASRIRLGLILPLMNEEQIARDDITEVGEDHDVDGKLLAIEDPTPIGDETVSELKKQKDDKAHFALLGGVATMEKANSN